MNGTEREKNETLPTLQKSRGVTVTGGRGQREREKREREKRAEVLAGLYHVSFRAPQIGLDN